MEPVRTTFKRVAGVILLLGLVMAISAISYGMTTLPKPRSTGNIQQDS